MAAEDGVIWTTTDPLGRRVSYSQAIEESRKPKHASYPESLNRDGVKVTVEKPTRIDSVADVERFPNRDIYYRYESEKPLKYARVVVDFSGDDGTVISWSRYPKPVQGSETKYLNPRNAS